MRQLRTNLSTDLYINLGCPLQGHRGARVISAQLLDEGRGKRGVGLELGELLRVLEEGDNSLYNMSG